MTGIGMRQGKSLRGNFMGQMIVKEFKEELLCKQAIFQCDDFKFYFRLTKTGIYEVGIIRDASEYLSSSAINISHFENIVSLRDCLSELISLAKEGVLERANINSIFPERKI
jgi:hypothetical protein